MLMGLDLTSVKLFASLGIRLGSSSEVVVVV